jgi:hypothetical protein
VVFINILLVAKAFNARRKAKRTSRSSPRLTLPASIRRPRRTAAAPSAQENELRCLAVTACGGLLIFAGEGPREPVNAAGDRLD